MIKKILEMKKLLIAAIAAVIVVVGVTVGVSAHVNNPKTIVRNSFGNVVEGLSERDEIAPIVKMFTKGSITVDASVDMGEDASMKMGGKVYFSDEDIYFENLNVKADDIKLDADVYIGQDYMYVTNDEILGGTYGVVYEDILDNLKKSIFASDSDSAFALDDKTFEQVIKVLEFYNSDEIQDMPKDIEKIYERYMKVLVKSLEKHAKYESEKGDVKVGDDYMRARTVTLTIDEKVIENIAKDLYKEIKEDKKLRKTVIEYADYFTKLAEDLGEDLGDFDIEEYYDEAIESLGDIVDGMEDGMPEFKFVVKLVTPTTSAKILKFNIYARINDQKIDIVTVDFGKRGIKKSDCIKIESNGIEVKYEISENNSKEYSSTLKTRVAGEWITLFKLTIDKKEDSYRITTPELLGDITIKGDFIQKGDKTTITLDKIKMGETTIDNFEVKVTLEEKDSAPRAISKKKIKDVVKISEDDIEKIVENVTEFAEESGLPVSDLSGIIGSLGDLGDLGGLGGFGDDPWSDDPWSDDSWDDDSWDDDNWGDTEWEDDGWG